MWKGHVIVGEYSKVVILLACLLAALPAWGDESASQNIVCKDGQCKSQCNPPCQAGEVCTRSGLCIPEPESASGTVLSSSGVPISVQQPKRGTVREAVDYESTTKLKKEKPSRGGVMMNPGNMLLGKLIYDIFPIDLEFLFCGRYVGVDIHPMLLIPGEDLNTEKSVYGGAVIGFRILPLGNHIEGLYIMLSTGAVSVPLFLLSLETGYTWIWSHFIFNLGVALTYGYQIDEETHQVSFSPNLGIGIGW